ncbi:hypothetical protein ACFQZ2_03565 [Streptomonospora algeriensis]|uniref:Secreted protein n=1 Tax=Streptomonospora algeriensis TaxID=995084 RepID=A0ABW3B9H5_9ACTN
MSPDAPEEAALPPPALVLSVVLLSAFAPAGSPLSDFFELSDFPPVFAEPVPPAPEPDSGFADPSFEPADGFWAACFDCSDPPAPPLPSFDLPDLPDWPLDASADDPAEVSPPCSRAVAA